MNTILERLNGLREEVSELEDSFDRYSYLVELSALLPPYPEDKRTEDRLVRGCQSHVWLDIRSEGGLFWFDADSDTLIIRGVLVLLQDLLNEAPPGEVAALDLDLLSAIGLSESFSGDRQKGVGYIVKMLRTQAERQL